MKLIDSWKKIDKIRAFKTILIVMVISFLVSLLSAIISNDFSRFSTPGALTQFIVIFFGYLIMAYVGFLINLIIYFSLKKKK
jgi:hypothetical protein